MRLTEIYVFQCEGGDLYALSVDKTGCNLPLAACKGGWRLRGQLTPAELVDADYAEAITAISEQGFSISQATPTSGLRRHWLMRRQRWPIARILGLVAQRESFLADVHRSTTEKR